HLVENRFVGIKSRGVYEAPGMELLGTAYAYLLQLVLDRRSRELFDQLSLYVAKQIYQGYGFDLGTHMARKAVEPITRLATGTVTRPGSVFLRHWWGIGGAFVIARLCRAGRFGLHRLPAAGRGAARVVQPAPPRAHGAGRGRRGAARGPGRVRVERGERR